MSSWLRWVNNRAANFNLSQSIRSASGRFMGRSNKHVREECDQSNQCIESCESSKSDKCDCSTATSPSTATSCGTSASCGRSSTASSGSTTANLRRNCAIADFNVLDPNAECSCSLCTDYAEYIRDTKGKDISARIRASDELRFIKQANADATSSVEYRTGIPTGVTI